MSEEYGDLKLRVPDEEDEATGADVPASFREYTDSLDDALGGTAGQLLVVQDTGAPAAETMKGDATLAKDGTVTVPGVQAGGVAKRLYVPGENIRTSTVQGSFATPIAVTLPKVLANQILEIICFGWAKTSIPSPIGSGGFLVLTAGSNTNLGGPGSMGNPAERAANTYTYFATRPSTTSYAAMSFDQAASVTPKTPQKKRLGFEGTGAGPLLYMVESDETNFKVELQGLSNPSGTITTSQVYLAARVWG